MPVISVRELGRIGRVGNQMFLFCFARGYALAHNCELQIPTDWWGREVFPDVAKLPPITVTLPQTELDSVTTRPLNRYFGRTDIDLRVFAQSQCYLDYYTRTQVREWLAFKPEYDRPMNGAYSAAHQRRGDYSSPAYRDWYCTISEESYSRAIDKHKIPPPVQIVSEASGRPWLEDFLTLRNASHLLRANSTFSFWAGVLSHGKVYSPVVGDKVGHQDVEFVEGNHETTAGRFANQSSLHLKE